MYQLQKHIEGEKQDKTDFIYRLKSNVFLYERIKILQELAVLSTHASTHLHLPRQ